VDPGVEAFSGRDDPAIRMTQRDRDRVSAAHQDAFHEGLTAVCVIGHRRQVYRRWLEAGPLDRAGNRTGRPIEGRPSFVTIMGWGAA
jgi:hypothetical protein